VLLLVLVCLVWYFMRLNVGSKQTNNLIRTVVRAPITVKDSVENLPAASWKAVGLNLPYAGTVDIRLGVVRGNPVDVFVAPSDQTGPVG
jgi:hypothetical protein